MNIQTGKAEHRAESVKRVLELLADKPDYIKGFYYFMANSGKTASYRTHEEYVKYVTSFLDSIKKDISSISMDDISMYLARKAYKEDGTETSGSYRVAVYSALKKFFNYLKVSGRINNDPMINIERPKPKAANLVERTYLKPDEIQECFKFINKKGGIWKKRNKAMFVMYFATGIRNTCLTEINVDNVDFENGCVHIIDKGTKANTVYLDKDKMDILKEWIDDRSEKMVGHTNTKALFINKRYKRIEPGGASWVIKSVTEGIGHKISPHKARASFLTNAYNSGVPLDVVSKLANHSSTKVTLDCYIQGQDERVKEAGIQASKYLKI